MTNIYILFVREHWSYEWDTEEVFIDVCDLVEYLNGTIGMQLPTDYFENAFIGEGGYCGVDFVNDDYKVECWKK